MSELSNNIFLIWVSISVGALSSFIFLKVVRKKLPIAHSVAIIGLPKSGKTTLITSIFSEIFSSTIKRVSANIER
ncbi:hypothetical protein [Aliivibrio wodanis]|uniref:hypothetical protein n=1 Tax=Aliivibrio wodanis TaxID=80852 RepID=UPI00406C0772